jgi:GTP-binding protein
MILSIVKILKIFFKDTAKKNNISLLLQPIMQNIRNIAIIAHVDHGKTTLVDKMIMQAKVTRETERNGQLILDNNELERERGITILSKNVSIPYNGYKINIIDTPGHADFGGEVERVLNMADGVLLIVDAFEGCMPQTRFVLQKALEMGKKPLVVINKIDKQNCKPDEVNEQVFDLMFALNATEEQLDFKTVYGCAKQGWMSLDWKQPTTNLIPLLDLIISEIPAPEQDNEGTPQMLISSLEYSPYVGRIAIGRVKRGILRSGQDITLCKRDGGQEKQRIKDLMVFTGMEKTKQAEVESGDICAVVGIEGFEIGDTIADFENPEALPPISVDEPTMSMLFCINDSPFFGRDGKYVTSRHLKDRLDKELEKNLALRVKPGKTSDSFIVYGRGVLHLSILIETMRREGFELQIGQPKVIDKNINGVRCEPIEHLIVDVPEDMVGKAIEITTRRKGALLHMDHRGDRVHLDFDIPARGIIGLRSNLITATSGEAIIAHRYKGYEPYKGEIEKRTNGSLVALETGEAIAYSMWKLLDRGKWIVSPGDEIYAGEVVGEYTRAMDLNVNICIKKKLTNVRASGSDEKAVLPPPMQFTLEEMLEYIQDDELVEVTPKHLRIRKDLFGRERA